MTTTSWSGSGSWWRRLRRTWRRDPSWRVRRGQTSAAVTRRRRTAGARGTASGARLGDHGRAGHAAGPKLPERPTTRVHFRGLRGLRALAARDGRRPPRRELRRAARHRRARHAGRGDGRRRGGLLRPLGLPDLPAVRGRPAAERPSPARRRVLVAAGAAHRPGVLGGAHVLLGLGAFELGDQWWRYYLFLQIYAPVHDARRHRPGLEPLHRDDLLPVHPVLGLAHGRLVARRVGGVGVDLAGCLVAGRRRLRVPGVGVARRRPSRRGRRHRGPSRSSWLPTNLDLFAIGMALAVVSVVGRPATTGCSASLDRVAGPGRAVVGARRSRCSSGTPTGSVRADVNAGYAGLVLAAAPGHRRRCSPLPAHGPAVFGDQDQGAVRRACSLAGRRLGRHACPTASTCGTSTG